MLPWFILLTATSALCCDVEPVRDLELVSSTTSEVRVAWTTAGRLKCVLGYRICAAAAGAPPGCVAVQNRHLGGYVVTGLRPCEDYNVSVAALGANGSESAAAILPATTGPVAASDLSVVREEGGRMTARWRYGGRSPDTRCAAVFKLRWCGVTSSCSLARIPVLPAADSYSQRLHGARYCDAQDVRLAVLGSDDTAPGSSAELHAVLDEYPIRGPENLTVADCTSRSVHVRWDVPGDQLHCDYRAAVSVEFTDGATRRSVQTILGAGRTSYAMDDVAPCTAYDVTVGFRTPAASANASTVAYTLPEEADIFENVSVLETTSTSVLVGWTTRAPRYECITSYCVCWRQVNTTERCGRTTRGRFHIAGLEARTDYLVSLHARSGNGVPIDTRTLAATTSGAADVFINAVARIVAVLSLLNCIT